MKKFGGLGMLNRKERLYIGLKWFLYVFLLLVLYVVMCSGVFDTWQPLLIIPLAVAVSMHEREFSGAIFSMFCGLLLDVACGNLFGMSCIWLMPCSIAASMLVLNLIRNNWVNHLWISCAVCVIMAFMEYLFNYIIWDTDSSRIILNHFLLPSYLSAVLLAPLMYWVVHYVQRELTGQPEHAVEEAIEEQDEPAKRKG